MSHIHRQRQKYLKVFSTGDGDIVESMLKSKEFKKTAHIHYNFTNLCMKTACEANNLEAIQILLSYQIRSQQHKSRREQYFTMTSYVELAMVYACKYSDIVIIDYLSNVCKIKNRRGYERVWIKCLISICESGKVNLFKFYVNKILQHIPFGFYDDCFTAACASGNLEMIDFIISCGTDHINFWNNGLIGACRGGHKQISDMMIMKGANNFGNCLYEACIGGNEEIFSFMFNKNIPNSIQMLDAFFMAACKHDNSAIAKFILKRNMFDSNLYLTYACYYGILEVIPLLIKSGANNWNTGLINACYCYGERHERHEKIVSIMLDKGATNYNEAYRINMSIGKSLNIFILMYRKWSNVLLHELDEDETFLYSYRVYHTYCKHKKINPTINIKYNYLDLMQQHPPYVLFINSKGTNVDKNCFVNKLPVELFRLLFRYL